MSDIPQWKQRMIDADKAAAEAGMSAMANDLKRIQDNLAKLERDGVPEATDEATYKALIEVVRDATTNNVALADLEQNVRRLGEKAVALAGTLAKAV